MYYTVVHNTTYDYENPVLHGHHLAHLKPRATPNQYVARHELAVTPEPTSAHSLIDYFGNDTHHFELLSPHDRLEVISRTELEVVPPLPHNEVPGIPWDTFAEQVRSDLSLIAVREFCFDSPLVRAHTSLLEYAASTFTPGSSMAYASAASRTVRTRLPIASLHAERTCMFVTTLFAKSLTISGVDAQKRGLPVCARR